MSASLPWYTHRTSNSNTHLWEEAFTAGQHLKGQKLPSRPVPTENIDLAAFLWSLSGHTDRWPDGRSNTSHLQTDRNKCMHGKKVVKFRSGFTSKSARIYLRWKTLLLLGCPPHTSAPNGFSSRLQVFSGVYWWKHQRSTSAVSLCGNRTLLICLSDMSQMLSFKRDDTPPLPPSSSQPFLTFIFCVLSFYVQLQEMTQAFVLWCARRQLIQICKVWGKNDQLTLSPDWFLCKEMLLFCQHGTNATILKQKIAIFK